MAKRIDGRLEKVEGELKARRAAVIGEFVDVVWRQPAEVQHSVWRWARRMTTSAQRPPDEVELFLCGDRIAYDPRLDAANVDAVLEKAVPMESNLIWRDWFGEGVLLNERSDV